LIQDLHGIIENIIAYFLARERKLFPDTELLNSLNDGVYISFQRYLSKVNNKVFTESEIIKNYCVFLNKHNASVVVKLLTDEVV